MKPIYQSATKLVLLLLALAMVIGIFSGHVDQETFKTAVLMVLTYYFTKAQTIKESKQEAGKPTEETKATLAEMLESMKE